MVDSQNRVDSNLRRRLVIGSLLAGAVVLVLAGPGRALPSPEASLVSCQKTMRIAGLKYFKARTGAIAKCLSKLAEEKLHKNSDDAVAAGKAANACAKQFRTLNPAYAKSLIQRFQSATDAKCVAGSKVTHTTADILGPGATVSEPLDAANLGTQCAHFGGDGSVDSLNEWLPNTSFPDGCTWVVEDCASNLSISVQYPRAIEWLGIVRPAILALTPPADDPTRYTEAVDALDAVVDALDGSVSDGVPDFQCGDP